MTFSRPLCHVSFPLGDACGGGNRRRGRLFRSFARLQSAAMAAARNLEVKLDSTLDSVDVAEDVVSRFASEQGFAEDDVHQIGMAVREGMINAVVHGNCYNAQKKVSVAMAMENNRLVIRVQDQGAGFDPDEIPDPLANENLMRKSGRGLFLMRAFMDEVQLNRLRPEGMEVVMIKNTIPSDSQEEEAK